MLLMSRPPIRRQQGPPYDCHPQDCQAFPQEGHQEVSFVSIYQSRRTRGGIPGTGELNESQDFRSHRHTSHTYGVDGSRREGLGRPAFRTFN